jgi:hypothetical protein
VTTELIIFINIKDMLDNTKADKITAEVVRNPLYTIPLTSLHNNKRCAKGATHMA